MKRIGIFLFVLIQLYCSAHAQNNDPHLKRLFQCIEDNNYVCAVEQIPLVRNWGTVGEWMDTFKAINVFYDIKFEAYEDSTLILPSLIDSFAIFIARDCRSVAQYYYQKNELETAAEYAELALDYFKNAKKQNTEEYALTLIDAGEICEELGKIDHAERYYISALTIYDDVIRKKSPDYVRLLFNLTLLYDEISEYAEVEKYGLRALYLHENKYKKKLPLYAELLNNLGNLYLDLKDYNRAKKYYIKALAQKKNKYGENSESYANTCYNLGRLFAETKDYVKAKNYHLRALVLREKLVGKESADYAVSADKLASVYNLTGEDEKGLLMYKDAIKAYLTVYGTAHPACVEVLDSIVTYYEKRNSTDSLFSYSGQLYVSAMQVYGDSNEISAKAIFRYATVLLNKGYRDNAIKLYQKAAKAFNSVYGEYSIPHAECLMGITLATIESGNGLQNVENYLSAAERIISSLIGTDNKDYVTCLKLYGDYYMEVNNREKASEYYAQAITIVQNMGYNADKFKQNIIDQQNKKVEAIYESEISKIIKEYYYNQESFYHYYGIAEILIHSQLTLDRLHKGVYSDSYIYSLIQLGEMYIHYGKTLDAEPFIKSYFSLIKKKYINTVDYMTEVERKTYWDQYQAACTLFIPRFSYLATALNDSTNIIAYDNELFAKNLLLSSSNSISHSIHASGDTTLIRQWKELAEKRQHIMRLEGKDSQSSSITELHKDAEQLEKEITRRSAAYRENLRLWSVTWDSVRAELKPNQVAIEYMSAPINKDSTMYCALLLRDTCAYPIMIPLFEEKQVLAQQQNTQEQSDLIWDKVKPYLNLGDEVFFSPTGILYQIPMENLPYDSTHTMGDVYQLVRLSSTRELAMRKQPTRLTTATLYGDIAYQEMDTTVMLALSTKYNDGTRSVTRSSRLIDTSEDFEPTRPLPGTKTEIKNIEPILKNQHIAVNVYAKREACEESLKALSGKKQNILHIATHGFFNPDKEQNSDPLSRCGLYFAGVDKVLEKGNSALPQNVDDGILTAKEISLLDLRDAELVVLSACETGKGDITGEGVFGLQRAFKQAGAQTIIMSLWPVDDTATQLLMTEFYKNWITNHQSKREAFHNAQNTVRSKHKKTVYWAGFIMLD